MRIHEAFLNSTMFNKHLKKAKSPYVSYARCAACPRCAHTPCAVGPWEAKPPHSSHMWAVAHTQPARSSPRRWAGRVSATGPQAALTAKHTAFRPPALNTLLSKQHD